MQDYIDRKIDINARIDQIIVKQFDNNSRYLHVTITDADLPDDGGSKKFNLTNCTAALYIQPAGDESGENVAFVAGEVADAEEGIVTFLLPGSVTQAVGDYECEIWMYEGSSSNRPIISGQPFTMTVEKSIRNTSAIMASSQYSALDVAMSDMAALRSEVNSYIKMADAGEIPAGTVESEVVNIRIGWDGYEYDSAGNAVREQVRELHDSLNEKFIIGKNVFNPDMVLLNYKLNTTTGVLEQASDGSMVSGVIRTHGAEKVIISYLASNGTHALQAFRVFQYKEDDTFLSIATASTVNLSSECAYIRFFTSSTFAAKRRNIMVELTNAGTNTFSSFEAYHMHLNPQISVKEGLSAELERLDRLDQKFVCGKNVFSPDDAILNYTINTTTGVLEQASDGSMVSGVIRTHGAEKVIISYLASNGTQALQAFRVFQYKEDDTFLSVTTDSTVPLSENCAYIRFSASSTFVAKRQNIMVELTDASANTFSPFERYRTRLSGDVVTALPISAIMSRVILSPDTVRIKLIGDSITHGVGSSDFSESGEGFVSYERTTDSVTETVTRRRNSGVKSWAALLESRIEAGYNATVTNNAVRGWRTDQILRFWDQLIDGSEDIVIVMIGTNNRMNDGGQRSFYNDLQTMKFSLEANGSDVIFMSAPPASASNESQSGIHFHMNDVDDVIAKFAADNNREYISLYKKTLDYMEKTGASLDDLLADGLHPNDRLHALMYGWILEGIGLNREHNPVLDSFMITTNEITEVLTG